MLLLLYAVVLQVKSNVQSRHQQSVLAAVESCDVTVVMCSGGAIAIRLTLKKPWLAGTRLSTARVRKTRRACCQSKLVLISNNCPALRQHGTASKVSQAT